MGHEFCLVCKEPLEICPIATIPSPTTRQNIADGGSTTYKKCRNPKCSLHQLQQQDGFF